MMIKHHLITCLAGLLVILLLAACQSKPTAALPTLLVSNSPTTQNTTMPTTASRPAATGKPATSEQPARTPEPTKFETGEVPAVQPELAEACPVSQPNLVHSPDDSIISSREGFGNARGKEAGTLFTNLWQDNTVLFTPHGPGEQRADGSLAIKWPWFRTLPGEVHITGERLDAPADPMPEVVLHGEADGYAATGFHPSLLVFPTQGCWEVTARLAGTSLRMVVRVVQLPFEAAVPGSLPDGFYAAGIQLSTDPITVREIFRPQDSSPGELILETTIGVLKNSTIQPIERIQVGTANGWCLKAAAQTGSPARELNWSDGSLAYRLIQDRLDLNCQDLLRIAKRTG